MAFLILTSAGCQSGVHLPAGTDTTGALPTVTLNPNPAPSVMLALLGDVMLGRSIHPTPETFAYLKPFLTSADLALANLESPLTNSQIQTESFYALCAPPENVKYLVDAGFDLLALSNNHRLDCGAKGLLDTQATLTDAGLGFIGSEPVHKSINEINLAFLAFDATTQFDIETATQAVQSAREVGAVVIVSIHWGVEYQSGPSSSQKQIAEQLAEAGAVLIWGHHPHVLQPAKWINNSETLVLYSLGNALFDQYGLEGTRRSALVLVKLNSYGVKEFRAIPFLMDVRNSRIVGTEQVDTQLILQYFK